MMLYTNCKFAQLSSVIYVSVEKIMMVYIMLHLETLYFIKVYLQF